jgi:hypothetical protein
MKHRIFQNCNSFFVFLGDLEAGVSHWTAFQYASRDFVDRENLSLRTASFFEAHPNRND